MKYLADLMEKAACVEMLDIAKRLPEDVRCKKEMVRYYEKRLEELHNTPHVNIHLGIKAFAREVLSKGGN